MFEVLKSYISAASFIEFLIYMVTSGFLITLYTYVYTKITPHDEFDLIRKGNLSASIALGGAIIGFVLPMASVISHSVGLIDYVIWALIAGVVQLFAFYIAGKIVPEIPARIERNEFSAAAFVAIVAISVGLINAACMTPDTVSSSQTTSYQQG
ncbi:DUF350 domain-containing protein [Pseudomonas syringae pv. actinidiae]|uniref:DUF350 domain-containing protein n=1 Tax=Pseudomonas viridiflava TaxID=33069 RepID=UPI0018E6111A|nr:DUF350 domain-containing protein [Pseudomonas viridiflava]MBI6727371.1 DUF350 domain-containing protein [Pseudomonas viridiflava]MDU8351359.1 DUF350 domain-containing protein [Pseudomonas syringae pv. actinidiae]